MYLFDQIDHNFFIADLELVSQDTCRNKSLLPVASESECTALTGTIQAYFTGYSYDKKIDSSTFPKGCFVLLKNGTEDIEVGFFNIHSTGSIHKEAAVICRNPKGMQ